MVITRKTNARFASSSRHQPPDDPKSRVTKFVLPITMKKSMVSLPPTFVKQQWFNAPEVITLETPAGFTRSIKLKRIGEEIWFHDGWNEFAEAHSIKEGYFLLFEYDESSSFRVSIFDESGSGIEYPLDAVDISDSDDDFIEITDKEFDGTQSTEENDQNVDGGDIEQYIPEKTPSDIEFDKFLHDLDVNISNQVVKEEEEEDERVFRG